MPTQAHDDWLNQGFGIDAAALRQSAMGGADPDLGDESQVADDPTGGASAPPTQNASAAPPTDDAGSRGTSAQDIAGRIAGKIAGEADLRLDLAMLQNMDMRALLDVLGRLSKAGKLEDLADRVPSENTRIGVAILTVRKDFDAQWQGLVAKLGDDDRAAVLACAPADVKLGPGDAGSRTADSGEPVVDTDAVVAVGPDGAEVQAKLTFHSSLAGDLGETEFTVHIGPNGKLSQFELDLTAIKHKIEKMGALAPLLELEATLSLNATVDLDQQATKVIFGAVQIQAKGEIEAHLKSIEVLKKVAFKLTATAGSGGVSVTGSIEFAIPGT
jgi:hypothetical protein